MPRALLLEAAVGDLVAQAEALAAASVDLSPALAYTVCPRRPPLPVCPRTGPSPTSRVHLPTD